MLILSRKIDEKIIITLLGGEQIVVGIGGVDCNTGAVKVGIEAPRSITVDREEIHLAKMEQAEWQPRTPTIKKGGSPLSLKKL